MLSVVPQARSEAPPQARLAELLAERVRSVTARAGQGPAESTVLVVLRSLRLADLVHGARQFAAALEPAEAAAWLRSWTRTRFLFGNPDNLPPATAARVVAPGRTAAWLGPYPHGHQPGLSRLLKPVTGRLPDLPADLDLPAGDLPADAALPAGDLPADAALPAGAPPADAALPADSVTGQPGPRRVLQVAVAGLSLTDYLVHLHHTLAEAVLLGRLGVGEPVRLSHRPAIAVESGCEPPSYARVLPEAGSGGGLRVHTWLSRGTAGG